ncbi:MAG: STAS domain-containing protein [Gammaproteobacteria bacterium]|nr:STAS domain-containing protein [Gammaproteobacteria bacterium]
MKYPETEKNGFMVISLTGEVDLNYSPVARQQILKCLKQNKNLLVDLSLVEYIDSSGVASLVEGFQLARQQKQFFALVGVSRAAMQVLHLARLDKVFPIFDTIDAALASQ